MEIVKRHTDYAIRACVFLAESKGVTASCSRVAKECDIPRDFAYKVLKKLTKHGLVTSHAGRSGGFRLNRCPSRISLEEVIDALQGPISVCRCVLKISDCDDSGDCPVSVEWRKLQEQIVGFLSRTTLQNVIDSMKKSCVHGNK